MPSLAVMDRPRPSRPGALVLFATLAWLAALLLPGAALAAGPPFPDPLPEQRVYDEAGVLQPSTRSHAEQITHATAVAGGLEVVVYVQQHDGDVDIDTEAAADALLEQWALGGESGRGAALVADVAANGELVGVALAAGPGAEEAVGNDDLALVREEIADWVERDNLDTAIVIGLAELLRESIEATDRPGVPGGPTGPAPDPEAPRPDAPPPGPPFPDPIEGQAVYDHAGVFSDATITSAEAMIDAIEARMGAEIAVYTQQVEYGVTTEETEARARALIDQWGIGRAGFDDGMVIFFDLDPSLEHGQVQLYAAPGFEAAYLSNSQRQAIFDEDMVPYLADADLDQALLVALARVDAAATPENAQRLQVARQIDAVLGLVGAPTVFLLLAGWGLFSWRRFGKDPVYLDSPSILMPAPPPDLTAASGAFVMDGGTSRRALTTALLDLASRGLISFREEKGILGIGQKVGIDTQPAAGDEMEEAQRARNARRPTGPAEAVALQRLRALDGGDDFIEPDDMPKFGTSVSTFDKALEDHVVAKGWMVEQPSKVVGRWMGRGFLAIGAGIVAIIIGFNVPISGLILVGVGAIAGGVVLLIISGSMPTVTMAGAVIRAMLAAYRRTLQKTMEQARSMQQVVDEAGLDWLETPDQAVVWGTALGLQSEIEDVLKRSLDDVEEGRAAAASTYFPIWYTGSDGRSFASAGSGGSGGSIFSSSAIPNLGGMMATLGTIGNAPSSSGGGSGGGGFSGGSSGGGGGGAGGGF
jgi:uncharacterized membrane protein YgcG